MKFLLFLLMLTFFACQKESVAAFPTEREVNEIPTSDIGWQSGFGLTHNPEIDSIWKKPVSFYLNNSNCDERAKEFYYGKYQPTDELETERLLSLVTTENDSLRPFYRWILNKTIMIQDGALGEYTGVPARQYAEKYPEEFFEYMDVDQSGERYKNWVNAILYSGFYDNESVHPPKKAENLRTRMFKNCSDFNEEIKRKIEKFSEDCFP